MCILVCRMFHRLCKLRTSSSTWEERNIHSSIHKLNFFFFKQDLHHNPVQLIEWIRASCHPYQVEDSFKPTITLCFYWNQLLRKHMRETTLTGLLCDGVKETASALTPLRLQSTLHHLSLSPPSSAPIYSPPLIAWTVPTASRWLSSCLSLQSPNSSNIHVK